MGPFIADAPAPMERVLQLAPRNLDFNRRTDGVALAGAAVPVDQGQNPNRP